MAGEGFIEVLLQQEQSQTRPQLVRVPVSQADTVADLKAAIGRSAGWQQGLPAGAGMDIIASGVMLQDRQTLADCGIRWSACPGSSKSSLSALIFPNAWSAMAPGTPVRKVPTLTEDPLSFFNGGALKMWQFLTLLLIVGLVFQ